ncbi:hypothetical protein So717_36720 [Roseobacter cerasinus]|uniref:EAL domain-containing protein n=1 Tax=Roseobacter cerasinus TaxID=2602289 RepID=A0A640VV77_9RHOB|nr:EAL domain-containing protein [Roseobacter cerasinus]GFE51919.1 hypothetical protein So717_36720 [Roseobacter cerasinus]
MDADTALTAGKSMGRNQTVLFHEDMRRSAVQSAKIAARIKMGITDGAFEPFFQPQIGFPGATLVGLEALARWKQPDGSHAPAESFIEVANETGLITEIDKAIFGAQSRYARHPDPPRHCEPKGLAQPVERATWQ